ncbi:MAG: NAD-dependent epimerase/dehydratase family protein [Flavobacteriales bacterium]|nr:MAG: NAD-dependent epimerase/dehydratase family protein [Flavobacteriales bacterium]
MKKTILVIGATGHLGGKIIACLLAKGAHVKALVRLGSNPETIKVLEEKNVQVLSLNLLDKSAITAHCGGVDCVVSALAGLDETILVTQQNVLDAAVAAGVPRFIASDYCIDFRNLVPGKNRNLDLRREFHAYLDQQPIQASSIFNGAFMELLVKEMPLILSNKRRILCWGNPNQPMEFTHTDNVAEFTANVAMANSSARYLHIAGDVLSCNDFVALMTKMEGRRYQLFRPGGIGLLNFMIKMAKFFSPASKELYPAWQGMQYMRDMMEGRIKINGHDNDVFPIAHWLTAEEFLTEEKKNNGSIN